MEIAEACRRMTDLNQPRKATRVGDLYLDFETNCVVISGHKLARRPGSRCSWVQLGSLNSLCRAKVGVPSDRQHVRRDVVLVRVSIAVKRP